MIKSFLHKGLEEFFNTGSKRGIKPDHVGKIGRILDRLDSSKNTADMNLPGFKLHSLKGDKKNRWSVWVNGNWRITFEFIDNDAILLNYEDYH
ncbi:type II toxin-antitoxin system RelE/ParE family toxin [Leptospira sp. GIMC2001]|uniref:type II toxin-antitoxin system RelE/ParE family toxin n=1 Tax=Leptospira sp. GIMC2001 TaxID=1513297 RepID=UPI0023497B73|nr:type II toxin-antitoxin system RelE/ParE family toxin [Leptospira sp. GIMC2001]WCL50807.1 type II toxin-antitoxin system RelE/ParE family toxin [Leptospira sp. GIMC2001]